MSTEKNNNFLFLQIQEDGGDFIAANELKEALDQIGYKLPQYKIRELLKELENSGKCDKEKGISKENFKEVR